MPARRDHAAATHLDDAAASRTACNDSRHARLGRHDADRADRTDSDPRRIESPAHPAGRSHVPGNSGLGCPGGDPVPAGGGPRMAANATLIARVTDLVAL